MIHLVRKREEGTRACPVRSARGIPFMGCGGRDGFAILFFGHFFAAVTSVSRRSSPSVLVDRIVYYKVEWCMRGRIVNIFRLKVTAESTKSAFVEPPQKPFVGGISIGGIRHPVFPATNNITLHIDNPPLPCSLFLSLSLSLQATSPIRTKAHVSN